jgi:hypothetical protein
MNLVLSAVFILAMGACGSAGGCGACSAVQPLPGGGLPPTQTVEGGAQVRVTPQGLTKITGILEPLLAQQLSTGGGFCVPQGSFLGVSYCAGHPSTECNPGCLVDVQLHPGGLQTQVTNTQTLNLRLSAGLTTSLHLEFLIGSCTMAVTSDNVTADLDVGLATDPTTGELTIHLANINSVDLGLHFDGCSIVSALVEFLADLFLDDFVTDLLRPNIDGLIQSFLPKPLGLVGTMDVGNLLEGLLPGVDARMETRIVPGGYVQLTGGGLSLGMITGINSDRDPATRAANLASEPALCVPPLPAPDLRAGPVPLATTPRHTFRLDAANQFNGAPDPATDIAMGFSKTTLNLAGHHLVTSGALCLGIGTSLVSQLNVGTISALVPSLGELTSGQGNDPLLLVTRPQRDLRFSIGNNTVESPAVTIGIDHLEVDFYAFLFERYVRAFSLDLTLDVGVNVDIEQAAGGAATLRPMLVGITPDKVQIKVLNTELVRETPARLEALLPTVFALVTPALGNLPEITVPSFAGFTLGNPSIHRVTTAQDDFLAINASLEASPALQQLAAGAAMRSGGFAAMARVVPAARSTGTVRLMSVETPSVERVAGALLHEPDGALPRVTFDADTHDASGRELEWAYQLDNGMWRAWRTGNPLVIEDAAFAWQGKYTIGLKSRVVGDYHTVSAAVQIPLIIDSVAPRIAVAKGRWNADNGELYEIPAFDVVSESALAYAFGKPGSAVPASPWHDGGTIELSRDAADAYAGAGRAVTVFVKDEAGNVAAAEVAPFPARSDSGCSTQGGGGAGGVLVIAAALGLLVQRRTRGERGERTRRTRRIAGSERASGAAAAVVCVGGALAVALQPGCGHRSEAPPGTPPPMVCERSPDCSACDAGQLPFCVDNTCLCADDIPLGRVGPYSDVAVGPDGAIWVSAYAQSYGDLVVAQTTGGRIGAEAWQWVDGVPAGPVAVPDSKIRGGIDEGGPDVGMYTSIAVAPDGTPSVSYFDRETASLKLAQKVGGAWRTHVVDAGAGATGTRVGMYTSLTLRSDDGRPGIAYLAHVKDASGRHAEVRFASAQSARPTTSGDWQTWVVDTAALPPEDPAGPGLYPLPEGLGLFVDAARMPNQAPVVAYYDRTSGDLRLAKFNVQSGQFAAPRVLDGAGTVDAGWSPSVAVDRDGVVHVAYASPTSHALKYVLDAPNAAPQVIDNGYRVVGKTPDGLDKPELHFVGDDASLVLPPDGGAPLVVYQDATTEELLLARQSADGTWAHTSIAGATDPWPGGYGFFAAGALGSSQLVMSSWVVNLHDFADSNWVEVFTRPLTP